MTYYTVAEVELDGIARSDNNSVLAFTLGGLAFGAGVDALVEWVASRSPDLVPYMLWSFVVATLFGIWGWKMIRDRKHICETIRAGKPPAPTA